MTRARPRSRRCRQPILPFLSGLDKNKAINLSQKDAKQKAKDLKRSDRKEFEETRKRVAAEKKAKLLQGPSDDEGTKTTLTVKTSRTKTSTTTKTKLSLGARAKRRTTRSTAMISEGEEVGASSDEEAAAPAKAQLSKNKKKSPADDEDAEAAYLARLGKRKAREQYEDELERKKRVNAKASCS